MRLEGRCVLITGAGSGIGRALAVEAARRGAHVALCGRRAVPLEQTLAMLTGAGHVIVPADVTRADSRQSLRGHLAHLWGRLDVLVNNAGVVPGGPLQTLRDEQLQVVLATNLMAPMALVRDLLPLLRQAGGAHVVNVGSLLGEVPYPLFVAYSASKAGLAGFSTALRRELAPLGISVTHAAPRAALTEASRPFRALAKPFQMTFDPPEKVARLIWNAVERNARSVLPAGAERLFVLMQRLFPGVVDRMVRRQLAHARAAMRVGSVQ